MEKKTIRSKGRNRGTNRLKAMHLTTARERERERERERGIGRRGDKAKRAKP